MDGNRLVRFGLTFSLGLGCFLVFQTMTPRSESTSTVATGSALKVHAAAAGGVLRPGWVLTPHHPDVVPAPAPPAWRSELEQFLSATDSDLETSGAGEDLELIQAFVDGLAPEELRPLLEELQRLQMLKFTPQGADLTGRLAQRWAGIDAAAAALFASGLEPGNRQAAYDGVGVVWARQDLPAALAWAQQLPESAEREKTLASVALEVVDRQPLQVLDLARSMQAGPERNLLVNRAAMEWAKADPDQAVSWAQAIPDTALREQVLGSVLPTWADSAPVAAGQMALETLSPGAAQENVLIGILQRWAAREPQAAQAWVGQFPESTLRDRALENLQRLARWQNRAAMASGIQ